MCIQMRLRPVEADTLLAQVEPGGELSQAIGIACEQFGQLGLGQLGQLAPDGRGRLAHANPLLM
jgi:hypothetical protein